MFNYIIIGYIATTISSILYIPQLIHIIKRKSAKDISYLFLFLTLISGILWIIYAILDNNYPVIISSSFIFFINLLMLISKIYFDIDES